MKKTLRLCLHAIPVPVRDRLLTHFLNSCSDLARFRHGVPTVAGLLQNVKHNGFVPNTIIDVGAYVGEWSLMAASIFPSAQVLMIDANPENELHLTSAQQRIGPRSHSWIALLGPTEAKEVSFYQLGAGSSVLRELTTFRRHQVRLPMVTLDGLLDAREVSDPVLLKLDVQGFELETLRGGERVLERAEVVILETTLIPYNEDAPLLFEVTTFMQERGFAVYDFCGQFRRETDFSMFQTDVAFVKHGSALRAPRRFWLRES
jgi:FkbM family methyltransferase